MSLLPLNSATRKRPSTDLDVLETLLRHRCIYVSRVRKVYSISAGLVTASLRHRRPRIRVSLPPTCSSPTAFAISSPRRSRASSSISRQQGQRTIRASCPCRDPIECHGRRRSGQVRYVRTGMELLKFNWTMLPNLVSSNASADWSTSEEFLKSSETAPQIPYLTAN